MGDVKIEDIKENMHPSIMGALLKKKRDGIPKCNKQYQMAARLEYKNHNYISMMESGRANVPLKRLKTVLMAYEFEPFDNWVFIKKLHSDAYDTFKYGISILEGDAYADDFDERVESRFKELILMLGIQDVI